MGAPPKHLEPAKPTFQARPVKDEPQTKDLFERTMKRFPKTMARLGE